MSTTRFFAIPPRLLPTIGSTRNLWGTVLIVHIGEAILFGSLLDCGTISIPGGVYCLTVILYLSLRFTIALFKGFPVLTRAQGLAFNFLPFWGPVFSITVFYLTQQFRP